MNKLPKVRYTLLFSAMLLIALVPFLGACAGDVGANDEPENQEEIAGVIEEAGSTSVRPLAELMAHAFMEIHPKVQVNISGGGSSAGVKACAAGTMEIGAASRDIKLAESDLISYPIARDAVAAGPKAIGYLSLGYVEGLNVLKLNGVDSTLETAQSGEYPVVRRLYLLTREVPTGAVKAFLEFCRSEEGQQIAMDEGYIPLAK